MRKTRFIEHQIIAVLTSVKAGRTVTRSGNILGLVLQLESEVGDMEAFDIKKMKDIKDENRRLRQMFADLSPECRTQKDVIEKSLKPAIKRELVTI